MSDSSQIPTSFVPLPTQSHFKKSRQPFFVSIVDITILGVFILSIFMALGMYVYQIYLYNQLESAQKAVQIIQHSTTPVQKLITLNNRIITAQKLLDTHTTMSRFFDVLSFGTPKNISFSSLNIILNPKDSIANMKAFGTATDFSTLVTESRSMKQNPDIFNINFSDISVNNNNGNIKFAVSATLSKNLIENFSALVGSIATSTTSQMISSSTPKDSSATTTP